jgi:hypothetical protein
MAGGGDRKTPEHIKQGMCSDKDSALLFLFSISYLQNIRFIYALDVIQHVESHSP